MRDRGRSVPSGGVEQRRAAVRGAQGRSHDIASSMDITIKDAKGLWSSIWHKEELVNKKRRWLMLSPDVLKRSRKPKFLKNTFLAESYLRSDEVSPETVKMNLVKSYRSASDNEERLVVQNYTLPCDIQKLGSYFLEPTNLKKFHSTLDLMNNNALSLLANLVTEIQNNFDRTRPRMKKIIKNHFPDILSASNNMESFAPLLQLSEILRDPRNYHGKLPSFMTPACSYSLSSIYQALELVENLPIFVLCELNKNLLGKTVVPKFPPPKIGYNKNVLVDRIKRRCWKQILDINDGNSMPRDFAKALSIILLYFKQKTKRSDVSTSTFLPFSIEKVNLQNDILQALWTLPKATPYQLKDLRSIMGLKLEDDSSRFMGYFKKYLMQYLFECDEIDLPRKIFDVLAVLNEGSCIKKRKKKKKEDSCKQPQICPKEIIEEKVSMETIEAETEAVLNLSSALKQILSNLQSKTSCDDKTEEGLESDSETESNGFALVENDYCSSPGEYQCQQKKDFCDNDDVETTGDSMLGTYFISATINKCDILPSEPPSKSIMHGSVTTLKEEQDVHDFQPNCRESMGSVLQTTQQASEDSRDISLKEFCDETSLVSYRLIDDMLDRFLLEGGCNVDAINRHQLTGEASSSETFQDAFVDDVGIKILVQSVRDKLPSLPKRCIHRVKNFIKQS